MDVLPLPGNIAQCYARYQGINLAYQIYPSTEPEGRLISTRNDYRRGEDITYLPFRCGAHDAAARFALA